MVFFSDPTDHYSHRVRIVLAEKGVTVDLVEGDTAHPPAELGDLNPYNSMPTLVDRDLVLYESHVMMEYLDERFPHPPLLPVYPVARAESRLFMWRIEKDWCSLIESIQNSRSDNVVKKATKELRESILAISHLNTINQAQLQTLLSDRNFCLIFFRLFDDKGVGILEQSVWFGKLKYWYQVSLWSHRQ